MQLKLNSEGLFSNMEEKNTSYSKKEFQLQTISVG